MAEQLYSVYHSKDFVASFVPPPVEAFPESHELVATVQGENPEHIYRLTQNVDESWTEGSRVIELLGRRYRSTSVGDVLVDESGRRWVVEPVGMREF